jgi:hypothetical protein
MRIGLRRNVSLSSSFNSLVLSLLLTIGCKGGQEESAQPRSNSQSRPLITVRGRISMQGLMPRQTPIKLDSSPECAQLSPEGLFPESIVVGKEKQVRWAFVFIKQGLEGPFPNKHGDVSRMLVRKCKFEPHVLGVQVGEDVELRSADNFLHTFHAIGVANGVLEEGLPSISHVKRISFKRPEMPIPVRCDVHWWERAYVMVLDHGFFSVSDETGAFQISGLPLGKYVLGVWHESFESVDIDIDAARGRSEIVVNVTLEKRK